MFVLLKTSIFFITFARNHFRNDVKHLTVDAYANDEASVPVFQSTLDQKSVAVSNRSVLCKPCNVTCDASWVVAVGDPVDCCLPASKVTEVGR